MSHGPGWCCEVCLRRHDTLVAQLVREIEAWRSAKDRTPEGACAEIRALQAAYDKLSNRLTQEIGERVYRRKADEEAAVAAERSARRPP